METWLVAASMVVCLTKRFLLVPLLIFLLVFIAACGSNDASSEDLLAGDILADGSSTVFPITEAVAEEFRKVGPRVRTQVGISGTGGGFKRFCAGETDISNASRTIKSSEAIKCQEDGIKYIELLIGWDGLSVVVNPENNFVTSLTTDELKLIYASGSKISKWNQVRPSFPNEPLDIFAPDVDSGTFDFFVETIMGKEGNHRSDYTPSHDDNSLVNSIAATKGATGYFGYAYFVENQNKLKALAIDPGSGPVNPTTQTIRSGAYPLTRPLFIYINVESLKDKRHLGEFVMFYLDRASELVGEVGYVPVSSEEFAKERANVASVLKN